MTVSVRLDAATRAVLARLARRQRTTQSEIIREAIRELSTREGAGTARVRPYEAMKHLIGCVRGLPPDLSADTGRKVRDLLQRRQEREGRRC
jgi:Arc/MetJ-type ribon-helix-helix transcriptional regulator